MTAIQSRPTLQVPYAMTRPDRVPARRYYDPEFFAMEAELLWPRVWQMACRSEDIAKPGDFVEYEILDQSVIVVRVDENTVKAYNNVCRHRGVKLVKDRGSNESGFICPFHGWCWGLDGANTFMYQPDLFDEANCDATDLRLTEVPGRDLGRVRVHQLRRRRAAAARQRSRRSPPSTTRGTSKTCGPSGGSPAALPANWKLAMEAFMEGYHVMETHPQLNPPGQKSRAAAVYRNLNEGGPPGPTTSHDRRDADDRHGRLAHLHRHEPATSCA